MFAMSVYNGGHVDRKRDKSYSQQIHGARQPSLNIFSTRLCVYVWACVDVSLSKNPRTKEVSFSYATRRVFIDFVCARLAGGAP